ncbi:hypothetical protein K402DRAFT_424477 [Aulographum hederae CBS 113979]|uniref:DUF8004 domain-containing protein n=1 Tax=Aulographum hederae CBS 113979 TaxID=1176131 RepID=A0A6G1GP80_9PEZI|nr:hypothetical protein K402DRAFT_424477 [Aulographum hederae CBS 113979]
MAARGARSRKVVEKSIQKTEKKQAAKDFVDSFTRRPSSPGGWASPAPMSPLSKDGSSSKRSHAPSTSSKYTASAGFKSPSRQSDSSSQHSKNSKRSSLLFGGGDKEKYTKGTKATSAPRGRGGGVPSKASQAPSRSTSRADTAVRPDSLNESSVLPSMVEQMSMNPAQRNTWADTKIWLGQGRSSQYRGFANDPDMWMEDGNCLVYFSEETPADEPRPFMRLHASILRRARSVMLDNVLKYGEIQDEDAASSANEGLGSPPTTRIMPLNRRNLASLSEDDTDAGATSDAEPEGMHTIKSHTSDALPSDFVSPPIRQYQNFYNQPTPPMSTAPSDIGSTAARSQDQTDITYEIWFAPPGNITGPHEKRRHYIAVRNFLALICGKNLVGPDFFEMLYDLEKVMRTYYEMNAPSQQWDIGKVILDYVIESKLDDVRGNMDAALGLLRWCEQDNVQWEDGYTETFVHCVGMMSSDVLSTHAFSKLSHFSRHTLDDAYEGLQLKLLDAQERLDQFSFPDLWSSERISGNNEALKSSRAFQEFFLDFYQREYRRWPPPVLVNGRWLSRDIVQRLQADFGAIYDYLVDRNAVWDATEERSTRKWEIVSERPRSGGFTADCSDIPITDMLVAFDYKHGYKHIPHPFPLLPESTGPAPKEEKTKKSFLSGFRKMKPVAAPKDPKEQIQMSRAFHRATNIKRFGTSLEDNKIIDELIKYEKSFHLSTEMNPQSARLGRWILLYGVLQILSTVSVDMTGLKYTKGCRYFLSCSLDGCPPWRVPGRNIDGRRWTEGSSIAEATQENSFCWLTPRRWNDAFGATEMPSPELNRDRDRSASVQPLRTRNAHSEGRAGAISRAGLMSPPLPPSIHPMHPSFTHSHSSPNPQAGPLPMFGDEDIISELDGRNLDARSPTGSTFGDRKGNMLLFPPEKKVMGTGSGMGLRPIVPAKSPMRKAVEAGMEGYFEDGRGSALGQY